MCRVLQAQQVFLNVSQRKSFETHCNKSLRPFFDCTNQQPPQDGGAVPNPFGLGRNGCWLSRRSLLP